MPQARQFKYVGSSYNGYRNRDVCDTEIEM